jgi:hypothetical protein
MTKRFIGVLIAKDGDKVMLGDKEFTMVVRPPLLEASTKKIAKEIDEHFRRIVEAGN